MEGERDKMTSEVKRLEGLLSTEKEKAKNAQDRFITEQRERNNTNKRVQSLEKEMKDRPR